MTATLRIAIYIFGAKRRSPIAPDRTYTTGKIILEKWQWQIIQAVADTSLTIQHQGIDTC